MSRFIAVSDEEVILSMKILQSYLGLASEPCGAITIAAALSDEKRLEGKNVICVVSGRNRDFSVNI